MKHQAKSIRPFIGTKNFELSRSFYCDLGFKEISTKYCNPLNEIFMLFSFKII